MSTSFAGKVAVVFAAAALASWGVAVAEESAAATDTPQPAAAENITGPVVESGTEAAEADATPLGNANAADQADSGVVQVPQSDVVDEAAESADAT